MAAKKRPVKKAGKKAPARKSPLKQAKKPVARKKPAGTKARKKAPRARKSGKLSGMTARESAALKLILDKGMD